MASEGKAKLVDLKKLENDVIEEVKKFVQDTDRDINERWELFVQSEFGEYDPYIWHPKALNRFAGTGGSSMLEKSMYSLTERKEIIEAPYMVELLEAEIGIACTVSKLEWGKFIQKEEVVVLADITALKEEILSEFIWSFKFDW